MIRKAILATDLSKASDLLMESIPEYKKLGIEEIILFHVPTISFNYMEYSGYSMRVHIEARMINHSNRLAEQGIRSSYVFKEGLPSQEIVDFALTHPDAMIIIGSKGQGFFKRNLIGSTTLRVIQQSRNPVLMIRIKNLGKNEEGSAECTLETRELASHGLLLTDFSKNSGKAFDFAENHLVENLETISLMHVQDKVIMKHHDPETIKKFNKIDTGRLQNCTISLRQKTKAPVHCVLTEGAVVPEIIREVKQHEVSLVVLGTHGKGYFSDMVLGSTASAITQLVEANCLFIPMEAEKEES